MRSICLVSVALVALVSMPPLSASGDGQNQQPPKIQVPKAGVPEIMTMEGAYRPRRVQQRRLCHPRL